MMPFEKAKHLLSQRLFECGLAFSMRDKSVEKMICEGAILLIDRTGEHDDRIDWVKPKAPKS